jgi:hypothetical protein
MALNEFTQTCHKLYDRHTYTLQLKNGKSINFDDYESVREYWWTFKEVPDYLDFIVVNDTKIGKKRGGKGFA